MNFNRITLSSLLSTLYFLRGGTKHEIQHPPPIRRNHDHLCVWGGSSHSFDEEEYPGRDLFEVPSVFYRVQEICGYRWKDRTVCQAI